MRSSRLPSLSAALVAGLALVGVAGAAGPPPTSPPVKTEAGIARQYGYNASSVWVLTPKRGKVRSVVVYIHGWTATSPFEWHQAWLDHLLRNGSAVIFPVYQWTGDGGELVTAPLALREGLQKGFRALGRRGAPVVVAGFSVGGALAFYYAADARGWGVPRPKAVLSIFPIDPVSMDPGLARLGAPPRIPYLLFAADQDTVVGTAGAKAFLRWLAPVPASLKSYRFLRSDPNGLWFDHDSPTWIANPGIRRTFWVPLDRLVARARGG